MKTAFRAEAGSGSPVIAVLSEYDALPGIGHACGHNLIAVAGVAVGIALKKVLESRPGSGTVVVLGTPAEEGGCGKQILIDNGAFQGIDVAMMCHPCPAEFVYASILACTELTVVFHGKNAHASAAPWEGVNALDALISGYNAVSCLRQQIRLTDRVHGVILDGGKRPNIIPDRSEALYFVRSKNKKELEELKEKVLKCFEGAALSSGCKLEHSWAKHEYLDIVTNEVMADLYTSHSAKLGHPLPPKEVQLSFPSGSTDMGNVSYVVPSIHPMYKIGTTRVNNHTPEFTQSAGSKESHTETFRASKALAFTALDVIYSPNVLQKVKEGYAKQSAAFK